MTRKELARFTMGFMFYLEWLGMDMGMHEGVHRWVAAYDSGGDARVVE